MADEHGRRPGAKLTSRIGKRRICSECAWLWHNIHGDGDMRRFCYRREAAGRYRIEHSGKERACELFESRLSGNMKLYWHGKGKEKI